MASGDLIVRIADKDTLDACYEETKNIKPDILAAIDQAVFDKQLLVDILAGTCEHLNHDNIINIGDSVFAFANSLKSVNLPNCVSVGADGFYYCEYLTDVSLPSVTELGRRAFADCSALKRLYIPKATSIGEYAIQRAQSLEELCLPSVVNIDGYILYASGESLRKIWIGKNCVTITANTARASMIFGCVNSELKIFCEAVSKPSGWGDYWNYTGNNTQAQVVWGATIEDYEAY